MHIICVYKKIIKATVQKSGQQVKNMAKLLPSQATIHLKIET